MSQQHISGAFFITFGGISPPSPSSFLTRVWAYVTCDPSASNGASVCMSRADCGRSRGSVLQLCRGCRGFLFQTPQAMNTQSTTDTLECFVSVTTHFTLTIRIMVQKWKCIGKRNHKWNLFYISTAKRLEESFFSNVLLRKSVFLSYDGKSFKSCHIHYL